MTVIVGFNFLEEIVVVADTRVSYRNGTYSKDEGLRKLLILGNKHNIGVLAFAGDIAAARVVFDYLITKRVNPRRFVIERYKDDLRDWIEEAAARLPKLPDTGLEFMFCAQEPSRRITANIRGEIVRTPWSESHIYTYRLTKTGQVQMSRHDMVAIIGSGISQANIIRRKTNGLINFGRGQSNLVWARSVVATEVVSLIFQDSSSAKVGGPYEVVRILPAPFPSQHRFVWPDPSDSAIEVTREQGVTIMKSNTTGQTYKLYSLWDGKW